MKIWTVETATDYIMKVVTGKQIKGLTYFSAVDYLRNHTGKYAALRAGLADRGVTI